MPTESDLLPDLPHPPSPLSLPDRLAAWAESLDLSLSRLVLGAGVTLVLGIAGWRLLAPAGAPPEMELPMVAGSNEVASAAVTDRPPGGDGGSGGSDDQADSGAGPDAPAAAPAGPGADGEVVVHVAGAVQVPGIQRMSPSARVADAVEASGGATQDAELARINLAATVEDGQQIYVPARGEEPPQLVTGGAGTGAGAGTAGAPRDAAAPLVNVNTAGLDELESLPGIGPAIGQAIVDHREQHGPFSSVDQLTDVRGIGDAKLEGLRDHATV